MNERLKALRKTLELNQADFGARVGVTNPAISKLEKGYRGLTEQMILAICREFNVNEEWLRSGNGEMFVESDDTNISAVASEFNLDEMSKVILTAYVDMDLDKRNSLNHFIRELADRVMSECVEKARVGVNKIIINSRATDAVKLDLTGKAAIVFNESFPYIGYGSVDESELTTLNSEEQERAALHARLDEELTREKTQESKVSFAKESDVG